MTTSDASHWLDMRHALWPHATRDDLGAEIEAHSESDNLQCFVIDNGSELLGFIEVSLRSVVDGCDTSPVGYVEGWYVVPSVRRQGLGRLLVRAAEEWARQQGCTEMGSDVEIDNPGSIAAHRRLGYEQVSRVVTLRKALQA